MLGPSCCSRPSVQLDTGGGPHEERLPKPYITPRTRSILPAVVAQVVLNLIDVVVIMAIAVDLGSRLRPADRGPRHLR
jgi:hypothetical protein